MKDIQLFFKAAGICAAIIGLTLPAYAQEGYRIEMKIDGMGEDPLIMGNFFGEGTYVTDTSDYENGSHIFQGSKELSEGMYFVARNKNRLFDFVISEDQHFTLKTDTSEYILNMQVSGDLDNSLYIDDMKFNAARNDEAAPYVRVMEDSTSTDEARSAAREALNEINQKVKDHQEKVISEHPETFMSKIFRSQKRPEIPDDTQGIDVYYTRDHYWDNFDLSDPAMLRLNMPIYRRKVDTYFDQMVVQDPDTIIREIDRLAEIAKENSDTYKYFIWMLTSKYQNPKYMGQDKVFVHLNDEYFASGEMNYWANEQLRKNVQEFADQVRNTLIGMKAPELIMQDSDLARRSLYDIQNEYTIIYFFDPDCHHCKLATPVLNEIYDSQKFDLEIFAVSVDTSMTKMNDYVKDMNLNWIMVNGPRTYTEPYYKLYDAVTTPTIYILDRNKEILAKKIPVEQVELFLANQEAKKEDQE